MVTSYVCLHCFLYHHLSAIVGSSLPWREMMEFRLTVPHCSRDVSGAGCNKCFLNDDNKTIQSSLSHWYYCKVSSFSCSIIHACRKSKVSLAIHLHSVLSASKLLYTELHEISNICLQLTTTSAIFKTRASAKVSFPDQSQKSN